jgi:predicted ATP-grasp superfamily ATP-dependent carboligase
MVPPERPRPQIRVLIPEGSSLSAREAIAALGPLGYRLAVCDPDPLCVGRFSRFVSKFYRSPRLGDDPGAYLRFILDLIKHERFDVLLPVHENALLFSRAYEQLAPHIACAVAPFQAFEQVQSKAAFTHLLDELGLPHPPTRLVTRQVEIGIPKQYPFYIKTAYGTAGFGTWRVKNEAELSGIIQELENSHSFYQETPILIQEAIPGVLEVVQAVFDRGRLVAAHCYRQTAVGVGGSAAARIGIERPEVIQHLQKLGKALDWHGGLMLDYLFDMLTDQLAYIDPNPRMGETMNATFHGINIADLLVRLSLGEEIPQTAKKPAPIESHILISMLLGIAAQAGTRRAVWNELMDAIFKKGDYQNSPEDFSNFYIDFLSPLPAFKVAFQLLMDPKSHRQIAVAAVKNYALTPSAVEQIRNIPLG